MFVVTKPQPYFNQSLQALRGISVSLVVVYHLIHWPNQGGAIGVGIFFCISGFLITSTLIRDFNQFGEIRLKRFFSRRLRRLVPVAYFTIAINFALVWQIENHNLSTFDLNQTWESSLYSMFYIGNLFGYFGNKTPELSPTLTHFWSLGVEMQFYLLWSFFISGLTRSYQLNNFQRLRVSVSFIILISISTRTILCYLNKTVWTLPFTYFDLLLFGALFALSNRSGFKPSFTFVRKLLFLVSLLLFTLVGIYKLDTADKFGLGYFLNSIICVGIFISVIDNPLLAGNRTLNYLGKISYSLYCLHFPLIVISDIWLSTSPLRLPILIFFILLSAHLSYKFIERRFWRPQYVQSD